MTSTEEALPGDARAAMRAFLQRCEVRLSTMHRIAGVFINGAGLLFLFPLLFKDAVKEITVAFVSQATTWPLAIAYLLLAIPFVISLLIPVVAIYLLLRDLIYFYFTVHSPGFSSKIFNPRFTLSGLGFPLDEAPNAATNEIFKTQYTSLLDYILPFNQRAVNYFDTLKETYHDAIVPSTRNLAKLHERGVLAGFGAEQIREVERFNIALGLAGFLDRTLIDEVARIEVSLVRHALSLRRLVLRYVEALVALVWTTLASFMAIALTSGLNELLRKLTQDPHISATLLPLGFALAYLTWAAVMPVAVHLPVRWLQALNVNAVAISDPEFKRFEEAVNQLSLISSSAVVIALGSIAYFWIYG